VGVGAHANVGSYRSWNVVAIFKGPSSTMEGRVLLFVRCRRPETPPSGFAGDRDGSHRR